MFCREVGRATARAAIYHHEFGFRNAGRIQTRPQVV